MSAPHGLSVLDPDDGQPRHIIHRSTAASFRDLNARRSELGLVPLHPASSLTLLGRERQSIEAATVSAWKSCPLPVLRP
ncbi:hypothetical protein [Mesorhizobium waimense]|uniref:hypothetical protein n=1 Tax=Mesorhizobium waimense TaxID=1300307 RepID=UPI0011C3C52A|nr:hypothetical protein [Mesorhizobium waimense]